MKKMLVKFGFTTETVEKNREIWTKTIVSKSNGEKYFLSFCEFGYGILFTIKHQKAIISVRSFGHNDSIKDIKRYIKKAIGFFEE